MSHMSALPELCSVKLFALFCSNRALLPIPICSGLQT
jgi:hypothetical protein